LNVHVVPGSGGEYSDRVVCVAGVFESFAEACRLVVERTAAGRARWNERSIWQTKTKEMMTAAKNAKITPEMRAYYGFPEDQVSLTKEEKEQIVAVTGPIPVVIDYDTYEIICVPPDRRGRWEGTE
jgi:hypothetical protein